MAADSPGESRVRAMRDNDVPGLTIERGDPSIAPRRIAPLSLGCGCGVLAGGAGILYIVVVAAQTLGTAQGPIPDAVNWTREIMTAIPSVIARALEGSDAQGFSYTAVYGVVVFVECFIVAFALGWLWGIARRAASPRWAEPARPSDEAVDDENGDGGANATQPDGERAD